MGERITLAAGVGLLAVVMVAVPETPVPPQDPVECAASVFSRVYTRCVEEADARQREALRRLEQRGGLQAVIQPVPLSQVRREFDPPVNDFFLPWPPYGSPLNR